MPLVFSYATLENRGIREQALGLHHDIPTAKAVVKDFREVILPGKGRWPTLMPYFGAMTQGLLLTVTPAQLDDLDTWESEHYRRATIVATDDSGDRVAYVYLYDPQRPTVD